MTFLAEFDGYAGLQKVVVSDSEGSVLESLGAVSSDTENTACLAAVIARQIGSVGGLLNLGLCLSIVVRSRDIARAFVPRQEVLASLDFDPGRLSSEVEAKLRSSNLGANGALPPVVRSSRNPPPLRQIGVVKGATNNSIGTGTKIPDGQTSHVPTLNSPAIPEVIHSESTKANAAALAATPCPPTQARKPVPSPPALPSQRGRRKSTPPMGSPAGGEERAIFSGDLQMISLSDLFEFFRNGRRTGTLSCSCDHGEGYVKFSTGMIVDAVSPEIGVSSLRKRLVDSGVATEAQLSAAANNTDDAAAIDPYLRCAQEGASADPESVVRIAHSHVVGVVKELLNWSNGKFSFQPESVPTGRPAAVAEFDPHGILLQIFKEQDESTR